MLIDVWKLKSSTAVGFRLFVCSAAYIVQAVVYSQQLSLTNLL
jgi:hypothetical protein